jgi:cell division initiation protein
MMKLTPLEIRNMVFPKKRFNGIDEDAVKVFLDKMARDFEEQSKELRQVTEELRLSKEQNSEQMGLQTALKEAMLQAQKTGGIIKHNAEKESMLLLKESELKAEKMLDDARSELKSLTDEVRNLKNMKRKLKSELKVILQSYLDMLQEDEKNQTPVRSR